MKIFDVIIIGAGSVGVPTAMAIAADNVSVLVIDALASPGQGNNKKAIGGIRATHSDYGKIKICQRSIDIFSSWKAIYGDDLGWISQGYSFVAYTDADEKKLKDLMKIQKSFGLNIDWLSPLEYEKLVPGINMHGLKGSTFSPDDGSCSPLLAINAMYFKSLANGASYKFNENVEKITYADKVFTIVTNKAQYQCKQLINAAGNYASDLAAQLGFDLPLTPDCHEAAISEPVQPFFKPMIVDMRNAPGSKNYYFYQNNEGQVVFCITPDPPILGTDDDAGSDFFPMVAKRMLDVYPRLKNLKVRRSWRGQYPMTPDGFPIVGRTKEIPAYVNAVGMCGQGFMLGPGLGELLSRLVRNAPNDDDEKILASFSFYRDFSGIEQFK